MDRPVEPTAIFMEWFAEAKFGLCEGPGRTRHCPLSDWPQKQMYLLSF